MKRNVIVIISVELMLLVIAIEGLGVLCGQDIHNTLSNLWDPISLLFLLFVTIPAMMDMGEGKNFLKAFTVGQKKYSLLELKDINEAVATCQKLVLYGGIIGIIAQLVILFGMISEPKPVGPNTAVAMLIILYAAIFEYLLVPLKLNAEKALNKEMDLDDEE